MESDAAMHWVGAENSGPTRVLVVDDDESTAELWANVLVRRGFEVRCATHPSSALELASTFKPDIAVLDLGLPLMSGHALGERLLATCRALRLIAITADDSDAARERSAAHGFSVHMVKPIRLDALTRFVHRLASELEGELEGT